MKSDTTERLFNDTPEFHKLEAEWRQKLKDSGFRDIEYRVAGKPGDFMVGPNPEYFQRRYSPDKERYYQIAQQWAEHMKEAECPRGHVLIWALHSQGKSFADIVKVSKFARGTVASVVRKQKEAMLYAVRHMLPPFDLDTGE